MKVPNYQQAIIPKPKITDYLLSLTHPDGSSKARFFIRWGFSVAAWQDLAKALQHHIADHEVTEVETIPFGTKYIVEGPLIAPNGCAITIRSVWVITNDAMVPRLVTAYPLN